MPASQIPTQIPTLPERQGEFKRLFNAITGKEAAQLIVSALTERLANDRRFSNNVTFPFAAFVIRVDGIVQPRETDSAQFSLEHTMAFAEADPDNPEILEIGAAWPPAVLVSASARLGIDRAPDDLREGAGMEVPATRRQQGSPAAFETTGQNGQRVVRVGAADEADLSGLPEAFVKKYRGLVETGDPAKKQEAGLLLKAVRQIGYKHATPGQAAPPQESSDPAYRDPDPQLAVPQAPPPQKRKAAHLGQPSPEEMLQDPDVDPRERLSALKPARSVTIKPASRGGRNPRAEDQAAVGAPPANKEVRFQSGDEPAMQGAPGLDNFKEAVE